MKRAKVVKRLERLARNLDVIGEILEIDQFPSQADGYREAARIVRREANSIKDGL